MTTKAKDHTLSPRRHQVNEEGKEKKILMEFDGTAEVIILVFTNEIGS